MALPATNIVISGAESKSNAALIELYSVSGTSNFTVDTTIKYGGGAASWRCNQDTNQTRNGIMRKRDTNGTFVAWSMTTMYGGFHLYVDTLPASSGDTARFLEFRDSGGTVRAYLRVENVVGTWRLRCVAGATESGIISGLSVGTWYWCEVFYVSNALYTGLGLDVYASEGGAFIDGDGANSGAGPAYAVADIVMGRSTTETTTYVINIDDFVAGLASDYPPEVEVRACIPDEDITTQWLASTSPHHDSVTDVPYDGTDYVYATDADTPPDEEEFKFDTSGLNADWNVFAIVPFLVFKKAAIGFEYMTFSVKYDTTEETSGAAAPVTSYRGLALVVEDNPHTGVAWTTAETADAVIGCALYGASPPAGFPLYVADIAMMVAQIVEAPPATGAKATCGGVVAKSPKVVLTG